MGQIDHGLKKQAVDEQPLERALSAINILGERLRHLYKQDAGETLKNLDRDKVTALSETIEGEIIPRLMIAHKASLDGVDGPMRDPFSAAQHGVFAESLIAGDSSAARAFVSGLAEEGYSQDSVFLYLFTHAARELGARWERDEADFADVTIALCLLHQILREETIVNSPPPLGMRANAPSILLAPAARDQHVFGVTMVAEYFRRAGWRVRFEPNADAGVVCDALKGEHYDVLGLSCARSNALEAMTGDIVNFRNASQNGDLKILVGGRIFSESPELVAEIGADAFAWDAKVAPVIGESMLAAARVDC